MEGPASRDIIKGWLKEGKALGATHMIVACDTFAHDDYPVFVKPGEDAKEIAKKHQDPNKMSRVMEVYSYALDLEEQLAEQRAYHFELEAPTEGPRPSKQEIYDLTTRISKALDEVKKETPFVFDFVITIVAKRLDHPTAHAVATAGSMDDVLRIGQLLKHAQHEVAQGNYIVQEVKDEAG
jgi:hypothetical protein